jgi:hypothetical protein
MRPALNGGAVPNVWLVPSVSSNSGAFDAKVERQPATVLTRVTGWMGQTPTWSPQALQAPACTASVVDGHHPLALRSEVCYVGRAMLKRYRVVTPFQCVIVLATSAISARRLCLHWTGKTVPVRVECLDGQRQITAGTKQEESFA